jgi:hypothetical protein
MSRVMEHPSPFTAVPYVIGKNLRPGAGAA